jgi:hypothetical protein
VSFDAGLPKPSSRMLALIALVLWAYSLSLTAIVTLYATGTLNMMPAWIANPLLLWMGSGAVDDVRHADGGGRGNW